LRFDLATAASSKSATELKVAKPAKASTIAPKSKPHSLKQNGIVRIPTPTTEFIKLTTCGASGSPAIFKITSKLRKFLNADFSRFLQILNISFFLMSQFSAILKKKRITASWSGAKNQNGKKVKHKFIHCWK